MTCRDTSIILVSVTELGQDSDDDVIGLLVAAPSGTVENQYQIRHHSICLDLSCRNTSIILVSVTELGQDSDDDVIGLLVAAPSGPVENQYQIRHHSICLDLSGAATRQSYSYLRQNSDKTAMMT
ncbi:hypothetical protein J6590_034950 [Homalodisca vitripennis]|nr:hypothetical protein J6590_034950 [Homalodisca vitripennis]